MNKVAIMREGLVEPVVLLIVAVLFGLEGARLAALDPGQFVEPVVGPSTLVLIVAGMLALVGA